MKNLGRIACVLFAVVFSVTACGDRHGVIPEKKMEKIYSDLLMADQWTYLNDSYHSLADTTLFYQAVFEKYGYDVEDFRNSVSYYMKDPQRFSRMLKRVALSLESRAAKLKEPQVQAEPVEMEINEISGTDD